MDQARPSASGVSPRRPNKTPEELRAQKVEQAAKARARRIELLKDPEYVARMKERAESKKVDKTNKLHGGKALKDVVSEI